ncbi:hypothetical protein LB503_012129 [Fusarium chuoi]|nr:hypothetical protein LB503_012129 [Fusarium chuoi]
MKLMSPPGDQTSSDGSSSARESSQETSPENGNIEAELRNSFMELNDCLGSDRWSRRAQSPNSDDDAGDIGDALHMPQRQGSETYRRRSRSMSLDNGPPTGRLYPDEDEDSDIYGDDNVGPFHSRNSSEESNAASSRHNLGESPSLRDEFPSSEVSSGQRVDFTVSDEDVMQVDEPSTSRERVSSSEQRLRQAMASAARQTNAAWRNTFREHSEEVDELF